MGVHTGRAAPVDGRYTGLAVHRAARICAAGHGGQVLVSQATQSLIEDEEEDLAIGLRDLGEQRLKDIDRPVRLYQVAAAGLPTDFPPPRQEAQEPATAPAAVALYRRPLVLAGVALMLVAMSAVAVAVGELGSGGGGLSGVDANAVGIIDPRTNKLVGQVANVGIRPGPIAAGSGALWIGNLDDRTLAKLDPARRQVVQTIPLDNQTPTGIAAGEGAIWVAHGRLGALSRVDPQFNRVATKISNVATPTTDGAVAVGGGSVWAAYGDSTVARIDPGAAQRNRPLQAVPLGHERRRRERLALQPLHLRKRADREDHGRSPALRHRGRRGGGLGPGHGRRCRLSHRSRVELRTPDPGLGRPQRGGGRRGRRLGRKREGPHDLAHRPGNESGGQEDSHRQRAHRDRGRPRSRLDHRPGALAYDRWGRPSRSGPVDDG
jgi:hypothetical protein